MVEVQGTVFSSKKHLWVERGISMKAPIKVKEVFSVKNRVKEAFQ